MNDDIPRWTIEDRHIEHARRIIATHALRTPRVPATAIDPRLYLKLETAQRTGSFKVRGALSRLAAMDEAERARGAVAASAGNHGLGVAFAAGPLRIPAAVVVPETISPAKLQRLASSGVELIRVEGGYDDAESRARALAEERGAVFVSPYDDPWVAAGNGATLGEELLAGAHFERVVAPLGGGGLMTGLAAARDRHRGALGRVHLIGVQSEACPAYARSIEAGQAVERMRGEPTLAEGLEGGMSQTTFHHVRAAVEGVELVSEAAIAAAMDFARRRLGLVVEGSGAVGLAWALERAGRLPGQGPIAIVVTGGNL
ncbi:MAG: pyridoxal-phosphate dependent enzyme [Myxococcales bacterium]|nr:pyridoxal-phosphate dependent enzyme [Myxococcales bacterium]